MAAVFVLGPAPRQLLYSLVSDDEDLPNAFHATGFEGFRVASTMIGPLGFAALCMIALVIWWIYMRNPIPAGLVCAGLICALTRSAWIGTVLAISLLAFKLGQKRRLMRYALVAVIAFASAIPVLGIHDYLSFTRSGQDESEQVHRESLLGGLDYIVAHPFGSGAGTVGQRIAEQDNNAVVIESTYMSLAAEYGIVAFLCFLGFFCTALRLAWRRRSRLGYAAAGILIGFSPMMVVFLIHIDFRLACWVWFPVGLAIRTAAAQPTDVLVRPSDGE
jgi:hypothetical protein